MKFLKLDIRETEAQGQILQQLEVHNMQHSQMAPTMWYLLTGERCQRRQRVQHDRAYTPLLLTMKKQCVRDQQHNTTPKAGTKVHRDNQLDVFTARVCGWCCARNIKGRGGKTRAAAGYGSCRASAGQQRILRAVSTVHARRRARLAP